MLVASLVTLSDVPFQCLCNYLSSCFLRNHLRAIYPVFNMTHWQGSPSAIHPRQSGQFTQDTYFVQNQRLSASHLGPYTVDSLGYLYPLVEGLFG